MRPDIDALIGSLHPKEGRALLGDKRQLLEEFSEAVSVCEPVLGVATVVPNVECGLPPGGGILGLTPRRLLFVSYNGHMVIPLHEVYGVNGRRGGFNVPCLMLDIDHLGRRLAFFVGKHKDAGADFFRVLEAAVSAAEPPAAAAVSAFSPADEIAKLAALRDQGVITPVEFEAKKTQLLGLQ